MRNVLHVGWRFHYRISLVQHVRMGIYGVSASTRTVSSTLMIFTTYSSMLGNNIYSLHSTSTYMHWVYKESFPSFLES